MSQMEKDKIAQEFAAFLDAPAVQPPAALNRKVQSAVRFRLNPPGWFVFLKLLGIHGIIGSLTLLACEQFGVGLSPRAVNLMDAFMRWGESVCMTICGAIFLGVSLFVAMLFLTMDEIRAIKRTGLMQPALVALVSLAAFVCHPNAFVTLNMALPWFMGAVFFGYLASQLGAKVRLRSFARAAV